MYTVNNMDLFRIMEGSIMVELYVKSHDGWLVLNLSSKKWCSVNSLPIDFETYRILSYTTTLLVLSKEFNMVKKRVIDKFKKLTTPYKSKLTACDVGKGGNERMVDGMDCHKFLVEMEVELTEMLSEQELEKGDK